MNTEMSQLEADRQGGKNQTDDRRNHILDAAEAAFLESGLENVTMRDIADAAGISRVSLYRYFPERDPIAFEVAGRMLRRIATAVGRSGDPSVEPAEFMRALIDTFAENRDAHRYLGMFNHLYDERYPNEELAGWFQAQVASAVPARVLPGGGASRQEQARHIVLINTIMSFLEKLAARGSLMAVEQGISVQEQLAVFKDVIETSLKS
jgi:AcrR family transcriptional regulator